MADADPAMLAQMLDTGPDSTGVMPYLGGVLKGALWDPVKGAWTLAKRYGQNAAASIENPSQADPFLPFHDLQAAGSGIHDKLQDTFGNGSQHFWDTVAGGAHSLKEGLTSSDPETAGETLGSFVGPGELAKGLGFMSEAPKLGIWGGANAAGRDESMAARAQQLKGTGASDASIWDQTGHWNPPQEFAQQAPWHWISDEKGTLKPEAHAKVSEMAEMAEHGHDPDLTVGDLMHPDWAAFKAYPGLKDMPVNFTHEAPAGARGAYNPTGPLAGTITLTPGLLEHPEDLRETMLHEVSHGVQHFEQMPMGGSPQAVPTYDNGIFKALQTDRAARIGAPERQSIGELAKALMRAKKGGDSISPEFNAYQNMAGEANARLPMAMLADPTARPFELYNRVGALSDPSHHLVIGNGNALLHPGLTDNFRKSYGLTGEFRPTETAWPMETGPLEGPNMSTKGFQGQAFRAEGFEGGPPPGLSAADVVRHEMERGNVDHVSPELMKTLEGRPGEDLAWVGHSKDQLMHAYGPDEVSGYEGLIQHPDQIEDVSQEMRGAHVVHQGEEGTLLLRPSRRRR